MDVIFEFSFWADFALSPLLCSLSHCLLLSPLSSPPATFKCAFYQSNSWATAERSTDSAAEKAPASPLSRFIWLLLSRPVFPCEAAQLCVLTGLVKLLPCYPLSQHWTPSQSTARKNVWWKREFVFWAINVFFPQPLVILFPCPLLENIAIGFYVYN